MDVLSSDLYADHQGSDDSLPDLANAFGLKTNSNRANNALSTQRTQWTAGEDAPRIPSSLQDTLTRTNRSREQNGSDALARIRQIYLGQNIPQQTQAREIPNSNTTMARSGIHIDLDPISSSPSFQSVTAAKPSVNRAKSFHAADSTMSSSPLPTSTRAPLHRTKTFPTAVPTRPMQEASNFRVSNIYHEISDDDEDLRAAIAASLADCCTPQPKPTQPALSRSSSVFQCPDDFFRSSPPLSQVSVRPAAPPSSQISAKHSEPPSSGSSARIRDDTKRMFAALDDLTTNFLKRKNEDLPSQTKKKSAKKTGSENTEAPKPKKRGALTQEEKVD